MNVLSKNKKNIIFFHLKIIFFTAVENHSILHGRVFVMEFPKVSTVMHQSFVSKAPRGQGYPGHGRA